MTRTHFIMIASLLLLLSGCGASAEEISDPAGTPMDIAAEIISSQSDIPPLEFLFSSEENFADYFTQMYGISEEGFTGGVIGYAGGVEASEIAVLAFSDETAAKAGADALLDYIKGRADSFTGYVPDQAALAENSTAVSHGCYASLLICADPAAAQEAFLACFEEGWEPAAPLEHGEPAEPLPAPVLEGADSQAEDQANEVPVLSAAGSLPSSEEPEDTGETAVSETEPELPGPQTGDEIDGIPNSSVSEPQAASLPEAPASAPESTEPVSAPAETEQVPEDSFDRNAVMAAWKRGDPASLSGKNLAVYNEASGVISRVIREDMTPYQQELAIHDYITAHAQYDTEANSNAPDASPDPDNGNPYGMLVNGAGTCWGYSSTFQLFMDMLEIECITVSGQSGRNEHAWNMVRLDGEWYCVDVTWDDPAKGTPGHRYFNVTSQFLKETNHQWNEAAVPEAAADLWAYQI